MRAKKDLTLVDYRKTELAREDVFWHHFEGYSFEVGDTAVFQFGTAVESGLYGIYELKVGDALKRELIRVKPGKQRIEIPITEAHRGGIQFRFTAMGINRTFTHAQTIAVPWSNKQLNLELSSFRSPMLPGSQEEWRITVKGPEGDAVAAELLASMYDKSLDEFASNRYSLSPWPGRYGYVKGWHGGPLGRFTARNYSPNDRLYFNTPNLSPARLYTFGESNYWYMPRRSYYRSRGGAEATTGAVPDGATMDDVAVAEEAPAPAMEATAMKQEAEESVTQSVSKDKQAQAATGEGKSEEADFDAVKIRTNLNETAFFYPQLKTDEQGNVVFAFTIPEALTEWKLLALAHTEDLKTGSLLKAGLRTQKPLMITPNAPRFLREGDEMRLTAKLTNLSDDPQNGQATLQLIDPATNQPIDAEFGNTDNVQSFTLEAGVTTALAWMVNVPERMGAITYRFIAKADTFSDGEENMLPILPNRMMVTETMPLWVNGDSEKTFTFDKLKASGSSKTLKHHRLTLEFTDSPVWYAVQALPYLMEYPHECAEQTFSRLYANSLATHIVNQKPEIQKVFKQWQNLEPEALLSNLEKNQELKMLVIEETPWLLQAKDESARKRRIALLFDMNRMQNEMGRAVRQLKQLQMGNGAWPWFAGMRPSEWVTRHIVTGIGKLNALHVLDNNPYKNDLLKMAQQGAEFVDQQQVERYKRLLQRHSKKELENSQFIGTHDVHYLYMRSFYPELKLTGKVAEMHAYFMMQANKYWAKLGNAYSQAMLATTLQQEHIGHNGESGFHKIAKKILVGLEENAIYKEEMGMYWKVDWGWMWWNQPIETQAMIIEAFEVCEFMPDKVEQMKRWLLKNKQTNDWGTTKATVEACYALLLRGDDLLAPQPPVAITLGNTKVEPENRQAGTGYYKMVWDAAEVKPKMGEVNLKKSGPGTSWGAVYWQYFENLDKITAAETPLRLEQQLTKRRDTPTSPKYDPISADTKLVPGDLIRVKVTLRTDRDMEYVHLKDMRAAGMEPVNVLSSTKHQDGLWYYESTRDAATNFFIHFLPKGTYVFEYNLRVSHAGDFSNGISSVQCMYAPEFSAHSAGQRVRVAVEE